MERYGIPLTCLVWTESNDLCIEKITAFDTAEQKGNQINTLSKLTQVVRFQSYK